MVRVKASPKRLIRLARSIRHSPSSILKEHFNPLEQFICWGDLWYAPGKLGRYDRVKLRRARKQFQRMVRLEPCNPFGY